MPITEAQIEEKEARLNKVKTQLDKLMNDDIPDEEQPEILKLKEQIEEGLKLLEEMRGKLNENTENTSTSANNASDIDLSKAFKFDPTDVKNMFGDDDANFDFSELHAWLKENSDLVKFNKFPFIISTIRKELSSVEKKSDKELTLAIRQWVKDNGVLMVEEPLAQPGSVKAAMDDFLSDLGDIGKFSWKFGGDGLAIDVFGTSAQLGFKGKNLKGSINVNDKKVAGELSSVDGKTSVKGNVDYEGQFGLNVNNENVNLGFEVNNKEPEIDKLAKYKNPSSEQDNNTEEEVEPEKEKELTVNAGLKIDNIINFKSRSASVSVALKGGAKSWSFSLAVATSGGAKAHLSRKASESMKEVFYTASESLREIYKILDDEEKYESQSDNQDPIKKQEEIEAGIIDSLKPHWGNVDKAIKLLSEEVKRPVPQNEVYISFSVSGDDKVGTMTAGALTFTF